MSAARPRTRDAPACILAPAGRTARAGDRLGPVSPPGRLAASAPLPFGPHPWSGSREGRVPENDPRLAISNAITKMHREHYGRGAAYTRTVFERDYVIVFLHDIYTTVERTLIDDGEFEAV